MLNPRLEPLAVRVDALLSDPDNARRHGERNLAAVMESFRRFGQQKPLVAVRGSGLVVAGNARLEAARRLGWSRVAVVWFDSEEEARAFAVVDNRSAELAEWDVPRLVDALAALEAADVEPEAVGFSRDEVAALEGSGRPMVRRAACRCPECGFEFDEVAP